MSRRWSCRLFPTTVLLLFGCGGGGAANDGRRGGAAGVAGAESYRVKRANGKGASYAIVGTTPVPRFADGGPAAATTDAYVVSALNKLGESADSATATVTTGP